ncbi:alpha/beta hydrolase [Helicobacter mustelae]|nr:alpha/beta hydrolase [Helicobacter mustelae]STP13090.1 alpha/beta hydrolase [Helicobacter mustelae]
MRKLQSDFGNVIFDVYEPEHFNGYVVQIAHGMIEHRKRYVWLCQSLTREGFRVYINDHRGHGESIGGPVYLGEMGGDGFEKAMQDMKNLNDLIHEENPNAKVIMIGHSMGSLLARRYIQIYAPSIAMLVLTGSPSPVFLASFGARLCFSLQKIHLKRDLSALAQQLIFRFSLGKFNRHFRKTKPYSKSHWICSDISVVEAYDEDRKAHFLFTLNSFGNLFQGLDRVFSDYPKPLPCPRLPILMMSGLEDACGAFGRGVKKAYNHLRDQGFVDVDLKLYAHCRHEVFNEVGKEKYFADFLEWFHAHKPKDSQAL